MFLDTFTHAFCHPEQSDERIEDDDTHDSSQSPSTASHSTFSSPASHVLLLRDGSSSSHFASLCCPSFGSRALLRHFIIHCLRSSSIQRVIILSLLFPHSHYTYLAARSNDDKTAQQKLTLIDAVSALTFPSAAATSTSSTSMLQHASDPNTAYQSHLTCSALADLSTLQTAIHKLLPTDGSNSVLIVDGLSTLFLYHSPPSLLRWLLALRALPQLSLLLHADYACHDVLTDATSINALNRIAGTRITTTAVRHEKVVQHISAASDLTHSHSSTAHASATVIHTTITAHITHTRASGRTASKQEHYLLQPASLTLTAASHTAATTSSQQLADDINSTLNSLMLDEAGAAAAERQKQARAALVLPYAHTGDVRVGYGAGGLEVRRVEDEVGLDAEDELLDDVDDDVDDDLDI